MPDNGSSMALRDNLKPRDVRMKGDTKMLISRLPASLPRVCEMCVALHHGETPLHWYLRSIGAKVLATSSASCMPSQCWRGAVFMPYPTILLHAALRTCLCR